MTPAAPHRRAYPPDAALSSWAAPDGWAHRRYDRAAPTPRGRVLFAGGRGDVLEKYLEYFDHLHARGWSVASFDWRGQGGSGRLSPDPHVGHLDSFAPLIADLAALVADLRRGGGPLVAIGHSMGGHLLLRALAEGAVALDAAVLVAPMLGLRSPLGARVGARVARWMAGRSDPARAAWRGGERPDALRSRQSLLTADPERYADEAWWHGNKPELRLGPPSWAWLAEAFRSTAALERDPRLTAITTPILLLVAEADGLVDARVTFGVAAKLPNAELHRFGPESAHEILREADPVRDRAIALIDTFLDKHA